MINIRQCFDKKRNYFEVSYVNKQSNLEKIELDIPEEELFQWKQCKNNDPQRDLEYTFFLDGTSVKKVPSKMLNKYRTIEFLESLNKETKDLIYHNYAPRVFFCDIENGKDPVTGEWPKAENPTGEVTAISLVDATNHKVYLLGLKKLSKTEIEKLTTDTNEHFKSIPTFKDDILVKYFYFETEADLLYTFWQTFMRKIYFITGWNFVGYDWTYLIERSKKLFLDPYELMESKELYTNTPLHKVVVDYLELYKKFDFKIIKENFTLDYTASQVLKGVKKLSYSGTLDQLYINDPYKYYLYNVIDSYIVKLINDSMDLTTLYIEIGNSTHAEMHTLLKTITPVESIITRYYYNEKKVILPKETNGNQDMAYEGGYVFDPIPGLYKWTLAMDFSSLYPTVQRQFNISPETYKGIDFERTLSPTEIRLPNGAIFENGYDSVFRKYLSDFFGRRKKSKQTQLQIESEISELEKYLKK